MNLDYSFGRSKNSPRMRARGPKPFPPLKISIVAEKSTEHDCAVRKREELRMTLKTLN